MKYNNKKYTTKGYNKQEQMVIIQNVKASEVSLDDFIEAIRGKFGAERNG